MIEIPISKGYTTLVSDEDSDLADTSWWANIKKKGSSSVYVARNERGTGKMVQMHRLILSRMIGRPLEKGEVCDHINGQTLDNQRSNLRLCTVSQNLCNSRLHFNSGSGYKGVGFDKRRSTYFAYLRINKQLVYIGSGYTDPIQAARARDRKAIELHGEFASLNFDRSIYEQESSS